jgi:transposase
MWGQKGPLVVLEYLGGKGGGMNSKRYQTQVLEGVLKEFYMQMKEKRGQIYFQQDNASSDTSNSTKQWFLHQNIPLFYHPANSPNINPIELVWHELKKVIRGLSPLPNTVEQLWAAILKAWDKLDIQDIDKYVKRMPKWVLASLAAKGGHTRYWVAMVYFQLVYTILLP